MRISRERKPESSRYELQLVGAVLLGSASSCHSGGPGPRELDGAAQGQRDGELIYDQLVSHASECRICWVWRNQLWAVHKLCPIGAGLADRYAVAEARMGERD
jgi:hypothetical protein